MCRERPLEVAILVHGILSQPYAIGNSHDARTEQGILKKVGEKYDAAI